MVELRRFLGLVNFYRRSLPHAAQIQKPLLKFIHDSKKNDKRKIAWCTETEEDFEHVKRDLVNGVTPRLTQKRGLLLTPRTQGWVPRWNSGFTTPGNPLPFSRENSLLLKGIILPTTAS